MCGIVGLFLKDKTMEPQLGAMLSDMLITMTDRGPDSAGIAVYSDAAENTSKITVQSDTPDVDFNSLKIDLKKQVKGDVNLRIQSTHAVLELALDQVNSARLALEDLRPNLRVMSIGESLEIYKEVGLPKNVAARFEIKKMSGSHGIGHTRMATESAVTTMGAHPFNTGSDQCLVHNGSLSNHNSLRRKLRRDGVHIRTENDTEVGAAYLTWKMQNGSSLGEALESSLKDLDGFFYLRGRHKRRIWRLYVIPLPANPPVMAETEQYVAFGSEYRALVNLPGIEQARVWEPEPATVYFWKH